MEEYTYNPHMDIDPETLTDEDFLKGMRMVRAWLFEQSDWTQTVDAPLTPEKKAEWQAYRQVLRDFPETWTPAPVVIFPDPPSN